MSSTQSSAVAVAAATTTTITQYGFFFDQSRCIGCLACSIACKDWNNVDAGPEKWLRIFEYEKGTFPTVSENMLFVPCYHCENPVCIPAANGAMFKEPKYGAVLIDPSQTSSPNMRAAWNACPYGAIVFDSDSPTANASKCTMCVDRLEQGKLPACVEVCPMRALDFGKLSDLETKYGTTSDLPDLPSSATTKPAVIFKPIEPKKQLVSYDASRAVTLMGQRPNGLPQIYTSASALTPASDGVVGRSKLNIKPSSTVELMAVTQNDDA
jgi:anaerobic dimethyl sulfoxide reductase subunit B (iron-sulfur subunit)